MHRGRSDLLDPTKRTNLRRRIKHRHCLLLRVIIFVFFCFFTNLWFTLGVASYVEGSHFWQKKNIYSTLKPSVLLFPFKTRQRFNCRVMCVRCCTLSKIKKVVKIFKNNKILYFVRFDCVKNYCEGRFNILKKKV